MEKTNHKHKFNILSIGNWLDASEREHINVVLECACDDDKPELIVEFCDNDLLSAVQNYHGWLSAVAPALIAQDYRINDIRKELKGEQSND